MRLAVVREGLALLKLADPSVAVASHGFEPAWLPVFYNPRMIFNRDLSVVILRAYIEEYAPHRPVRGVDALSGTGVRAVRYALEVGDVYMHANDIDSIACSIIKLNIDLNGVNDRVKAHCTDANALLATLRREEPILFTDTDPFGSPAPFAQQAFKATGHRGLAAFTATDLAVLEGSKSRACARKYWARCAKTPESKEIGLRVLLAYLARSAAMSDKAVRPLLTYYADHYYRVYLLVERGARKADRMLENMIGYALYCRESKRTTLQEQCPRDGEKGISIGPLWRGPLADDRMLSRALDLVRSKYKYLETATRIARILEAVSSEASVCDSCIHYRLDAVASANAPRMAKISDVLEKLHALGYKAVRSHFHPMAIRTNAPYSAVADAVKG